GNPMARLPRRPRPMRCNAFAATGPATKDGKIVFGHITMYDLYPANFYNIWIDVKPAKGHRFVMQSYPGGMHSGMDYSINEIALLTLGTHKSKLYRSSKNEWIGDTKGFYWSCNNTKDLDVRLETIPSVEDRPSPAAVFVPSKRDTIWLTMYDRHKGKIDGD